MELAEVHEDTEVGKKTLSEPVQKVHIGVKQQQSMFSAVCWNSREN